MAITTRYGNEVEILGAIQEGDEEIITGCVAKRLEDGAVRSYLLSDLRAPGGAKEVYETIAACNG